MANLISVLEEFIDLNYGSGYSIKYSLDRSANEMGRKFLLSTLDEVRLRHAENYSERILKLTYMDDAKYFRQSLIKKEISGFISYAKQRDHQAHTLYNYLMGWYLYCNSKNIHASFQEHFNKRGILQDHFLSIWPFVSLLHDIGYLLEGSLVPLDIIAKNEYMTIGCDIINNYFRHYFWKECGIDSIYDRDTIIEQSKINIPNFDGSSIFMISDSLRNIKVSKIMHANILRSLMNQTRNDWKTEILENDSSTDVFDIWENHYEFFNFHEMSKSIKDLKEYFSSLIMDGSIESGLRMLDHGVISGLILLQYSTFYFNLHSALLSIIKSKSHKMESRITHRGKMLAEKFINNAQEVPFNTEWWWQGVVWATAAVALHNFYQMKDRSSSQSSKLKLNDDPLTYLGILVDILQEWDRYSVNPNSIFNGELPTQGIDMDISINNDIIELKYPSEKQAERVRNNLDFCLEDWKGIVTIYPESTKKPL